MCPTGSRHHGQPIRLAGQRRLGSSQRRPVVMGLGVLPRPVLLLFRSAPGNRAVRSVQGVDWHGPVHRRSLRDSRHRRVRVAGLPDANPVETILEGGAPRWFAVLAYTAIVAASGLSYLVLVPWFYSIPILASLALAPVGIALWTRSADDIGSAPRIGMVAAGSLLVALTITCRPTFILTAVFGLILLWPQIRSREMFAVRSRHAIQASLAAITPFLVIGE